MYEIKVEQFPAVSLPSDPGAMTQFLQGWLEGFAAEGWMLEEVVFNNYFIFYREKIVDTTTQEDRK